MSSRTKETALNNRFLNKYSLPVAVATAMFGNTVGAATVVDSATTIGGTSTTSYTIESTNTLTISGAADQSTTGSSYNGTIDGNTLSSSDSDRGAADGVGVGNIIVAGNLTMSGNIGSTNKTGNFTLNDGNTLILSDDLTTFDTANMTLQSNTVLNLGNTTTGTIIS